MNYRKLLTTIFFCLLTFVVNAEQKLALDHCKPLQLNPVNTIDNLNSDALLWKIEKPGYKPSYIYGTIHASDPRVLDIPDIVLKALQQSEQFILESLFTPELEIELSKRMFSGTDQILSQYIEQDVINKITTILSTHNIPAQYVKLMQPWAAYLVMNYPANNGIILDLKLLEIAREQNKQLNGLETLDQQLAFFNNLSPEQQSYLLFDSVCHYQTIQDDLKTMIDFYVNRDLPNLIKATNKYSIVYEDIYKQLYEQLVIVRNRNMTNNIIENIKTSSNFIAIGSLHLVGAQGVVALLKQQGYKLTPIY